MLIFPGQKVRSCSFLHFLHVCSSTQSTTNKRIMWAPIYWGDLFFKMKMTFQRLNEHSRAELTNEWGLPSNQRLHITSGIAVLVEGSSWWITDANIGKVEGFVMKSKSKHHGQWKRRICEGFPIHFSKYIWTTKCINASFIPASLLVRCCNNWLHISMYYRLGLAST